MLSDPASEIISRFGILNTFIEPGDHPWYGLPFPGSYVIDDQGLIAAKFFESSLAMRANADELLRAAEGEQIEVESAPPPLEVTFEVALDGDTLRSSIKRELVATFRVPAGQHLYGEPVPEGLVATSIELDEIPGLVVQAPVLPATTLLTLAGTGETLNVYEGDVVIRLPIMYADGASLVRVGTSSEVTLAGTVSWQACDEAMCFLPVRRRFELTVPVSQLNLQEFRREEGSTRMNYRAQVTRLLERNTTETSSSTKDHT